MVAIYFPHAPQHKSLTHPYQVIGKTGEIYAWCDCARQAALIFATDTNAHGLIATHLGGLRLMPHNDYKTPTRHSADELQTAWRRVLDSSHAQQIGYESLTSWRQKRQAAGLVRK